MQYFTPEGSFFVGDCMPFFHKGTFHLFWLLDENHHQSRGGLGCHQWAHSSSTDLINWEHHPLAIGIDKDWEGSICTGSVFYHNGTYYAYYATRMPDRKQHLSLATSTDGVHFTKTQPNPFASPEKGYSPYHYRDPHVFYDRQTDLFHAIVTAMLEDYSIPDRGGCLAHLISKDLKDWELAEPFLIPGYPGAVPECPDYFHWNGWYYLIFSCYGSARYRMSRTPLGPWIRPGVDTFDGPMARVMKTAGFKDNRRMGVAFIGTREGDKDNGGVQYAGNAVFREIIQYDDGTLGAKFPAEMIPESADVLDLPLTALTPGVTGFHVKAVEGFEAGMLTGVPTDARITVQVKPEAGSAAFGIRLRGSGNYEGGYELRFSPYEQKVELQGQSISCVEGIDRPFALDVILKDDIIDVCIDDRRCLVNRCPELRGDRLFFFCQNGEVVFDSMEIRPLL